MKNRDDAKLLIYIKDEDEIIHTNFGKIFDFIPKNCGVIINNTKVVKARIFGRKSTGGKIELLLNSPLQNNLFSAYIRGKVKEKTLLKFDLGLSAIVKELHEDGLRIVEFFQNKKPIDSSKLFNILDTIGHVPLPPYIKREDNKDDEKEYQSVFAEKKGAVAAPTASLHFSNENFSKLKQNFETKEITLHVGAGTFKPVTCKNINEHKMHSEYYEISHDTKQLIDSQKPILAVGTTVTRTIEYYIRTKKTDGYCDLFLHPENKPKRVNHLLTNFHLPKSTLIMLVAAFIDIEKTLSLYNEAVKRKYRFFSYGDAMLIL